MKKEAVKFQHKNSQANNRKAPIKVTRSVPQDSPEEEVRDKYFIFDWKCDDAQDLSLFMQKKECIDILQKQFEKIDFAPGASSNQKHMVVVDAKTGKLIVTKIPLEQSLCFLGGLQGIKNTREFLNETMKVKTDVCRGKNHLATTGIKLYGWRKDPRGTGIGTYSFKKDVLVSKQARMKGEAARLSQRMEKATSRILSQLQETFDLNSIRHSMDSYYPGVGNRRGVGHLWHEELAQHYGRNKDDDSDYIPEEDGDAAAEDGESTAVAISRNYCSKAHKDSDYYYSRLSVIGPEDANGEVVQCFVFPSHKFFVPLRTGDIIAFDPTVYHCASNPCFEDTFIFSSYVSSKTLNREKALQRMRAAEAAVLPR
jgi:hypothetical protein